MLLAPRSMLLRTSQRLPVHPFVPGTESAVPCPDSPPRNSAPRDLAPAALPASQPSRSIRHHCSTSSASASSYLTQLVHRLLRTCCAPRKGRLLEDLVSARWRLFRRTFRYVPMPGRRYGCAFGESRAREWEVVGHGWGWVRPYRWIGWHLVAD